MRLTYIKSDKNVGIDGKFLKIDNLIFDPEVDAIQWYDTYGEIEFINRQERNNETFDNIDYIEPLIDLWNNEKQRLEDEKIAQAEALEAIEAAIDYWKELRSLRDRKLTECDWTQTLDAPLTEEQKTAWATYRQALRDLPKNITDPKVLVNDSSDSGWPIEP